MRYKVELSIMAAGWLEKGMLTEADLMETQTAIYARYVVENPDTVEETDEQLVS